MTGYRLREASPGTATPRRPRKSAPIATWCRSAVRPIGYRVPPPSLFAATGSCRLPKSGVLEAISDARPDGFVVGEDYSVTDRVRGGTAEFRAARLAAAQGHALFILHRVATLVTSDHQLTTHIAAATKDIDALSFNEGHGIDDTIVGADKHDRVQAVDYHTLKDAPNPEPDPPPGGWSSDPLMRAAQKIAYDMRP